jgi:hypothetical protein
MSEITLSPDQLLLADAIAERVIRLMGPRAVEGQLVDAATVAESLGVKRDYVYRHAKRLGAKRPSGPGGRLRFDLNAIMADLSPRSDRERSRDQELPAKPKKRRSTRARPGSGDELLPITGPAPSSLDAGDGG